MADTTISIVVLEGDQTGQELLEQSLRLLDPELLELDFSLQRFDLSLEHRRATSNGVVREAAAAMREAGLGLKAATITPEGADDVGSPNRILREEVGGKVIIRTGRRLPGSPRSPASTIPVSVVRMAVEDAYGAEQWRSRVIRARRTRSPSAPSGSPAPPATPLPSTRFGRPPRWALASTAGRNGPFRPCTRECSRRSSTRPPAGIRTCRTSRC